MVDQLQHLLASALGIDAGTDLSPWQAALRAAVLYLGALVIIRLGNRRFLSRSAPFDLIVIVMLGSLISRAISGSAPLVPALAAALLLVLAHAAIAALSFHSRIIARLAKGEPLPLLQDGRLRQDQMRRVHIGEHDLLEALRAQGRIASVEEAETIQLERSGEISVIKKKRPPRIVEIDVKDGVQRVRLEIG